MRRLVEFAFSLVPLDAIGERAVNETLADWRHEASGAPTVLRRLSADTRGLVAMMSVLGRVTLHELRTPQTWLTIACVLGLALILSAAMTFIYRPWGSLSPGGNWTVAAWLWLTLLPQSFAVTLPLALLTPPVARGRTVPLLALAVVAMFAAGQNIEWTVAANQSFRRTVLESRSGPTSGPSPASSSQSRVVEPPRGEADRPGEVHRFLNELSFVQLFRAARQDDRAGAVARGHLSHRFALIVAAPVFLLLGVQARRFGRSRGWRFGAATAWSAACAAFALTLLTLTALQWSGLAAAWYEWYRFSERWAVVLIAGLISCVLARLADRPKSALQNP